MANDTEQKRFLAEHWEILDMHYLKSKTVRQIAALTDRRENSVRRVISKAWDMGVTCGDVQHYMQHV